MKRLGLDYIDKLSMMGVGPGLKNMKRALSLLGSPEGAFPSVLVAGTNGKGSTITMMHDVLLEEGYKLGLYTSPSIHNLNERMSVNGVPISDDDLNRLGLRIKKIAEEHQIPITQFEALTLIALLFYREQKVDLALVEVGLGGRLDATNVLTDKKLNLLTHVGLDHMEFLGDTVEKIAADKLHIVHEGEDLAVLAQKQSVLSLAQERVEEMGGRLFVSEPEQLLEQGEHLYTYKSHGPFPLKMHAPYQRDNAALALTALDVLAEKGFPVTEESIVRGLSRAQIPGRFERLSTSPLVYVDGAHNPQGVEAMLETLEERHPDQKGSILFVYATYKDKDYERAIELTLPWAKCYHLSTAPGERGLDAKVLKEIIEEKGGKAIFHKSQKEAIASAIPEAHKEIILIFGTLSTLADTLLFFGK